MSSVAQNSHIVIENIVSIPGFSWNWEPLATDSAIVVAHIIQNTGGWDWGAFMQNQLQLWPLDEHKCEAKHKIEKYSGEEIDCSMCLECIKQESDVYSLQCGHKFHSDKCINDKNIIDWIREHGTCPYCRAKAE